MENDKPYKPAIKALDLFTEIRKYVLGQTVLKVNNLYIAQVKRTDMLNVMRSVLVLYGHLLA